MYWYALCTPAIYKCGVVFYWCLWLTRASLLNKTNNSILSFFYMTAISELDGMSHDVMDPDDKTHDDNRYLILILVGIFILFIGAVRPSLTLLVHDFENNDTGALQCVDTTASGVVSDTTASGALKNP